MPDLDPRAEHLLRPLADDVARATELPPFDGVRARHDVHRRRARRRTGAVVSVAAVTAAVVAVGAVTVVGGDRADEPGPAAPSSSATAPSSSATAPGTAEEQALREARERSEALTDIGEDAEAAALVAGGEAHGSAVTPGGDVATLWSSPGEPTWALAVRRADGSTVAALLPFATTVPRVHSFADGFLVFDPSSAASVVVDLDGQVTDPAPDTEGASPAPGDVAIAGIGRADTVQVYSPDDGALRSLPPVGVDRLGGAVMTSAGDVVVLWATFGVGEENVVGAARWDGTAWQRQTFDTTPASAGGVTDEVTDTGLLTTAGSWVVATTTDDRGGGTVRTAWVSDGGGAGWVALDRTVLPSSLTGLVVTPEGTVVASGYSREDDGELLRSPRAEDASPVTGPVLADLRWEAGALWGTEEAESGSILHRSTDDGRTWQQQPLAGR